MIHEHRKQFVYRYKQYSLIQSIVKGYEVTVNDLGSDILSLSHSPHTLSTLSTSPIFFFVGARMDCAQNFKELRAVLNESGGGEVLYERDSRDSVQIMHVTIREICTSGPGNR